MKKQNGLSLIEVLISVIILALGLLGLAALQTRSVVMNQSSYYRSIAADVASELSDIIRANRTPFLANSDADHAIPLPPDFSVCNQNTSNRDNITCGTQAAGHETYQLDADMREWNSYLRSQLPDARYSMVAEAGQSAGFYRYTLTISWIDNRSDNSSVDPQTSSYITVIE